MAFVRTGKGTRLMSEQFTFQQAFRQSCTVNLEKGLVPARRQVVKPVSDQFLAGSPFTSNDYGPVEQGGTGNVVSLASHF